MLMCVASRGDAGWTQCGLTHTALGKPDPDTIFEADGALHNYQIIRN